MSHTNRYHELKKLSIFLRRASEIVERMAENEDLPIFDVELEKSLHLAYDDFRNHISKLNNNLF